MTPNAVPPVRPAGEYGVDAPWVPVLWLGLALLFAVLEVFAVLGGWGVPAQVWFVGGGLVWLAGGLLYLHATRRGKFVVWAAVLDGLSLRGDERALDVGCGRGAVLAGVALRLPRGAVTGVDLWRSVDQSGNAPEATAANLRANGVLDRVELDTADMTSLPYPDAAFDLVTASLSIHNVPTAEGRAAAVREALRVLAPGGRLVVLDISRTAEYAQVLTDAGASVRTRGAGWRMWWTGPWMATRELVATHG